MARLGALNTGTDITAGGGGSGATQALMETRTLAAAATIDVAVKSLRTAGYASPGDGGHGLYKRLQSAPTAPTNKAYFRSIDRVKADGTTDATNGGYWELVPEGGMVRIEQFGGNADWNGSSGTDNAPPLTDALAFIARTHSSQIKYTHIIQFDGGDYYFGTGQDLHVITRIRGIGRLGEGQGAGFATRFFFSNSVTHPFVLGNTSSDGATGTVGGTAGTSGGTTLEGFSIHYSGSQTLDHTKAGILCRATPNILDVGFYNLPGRGLYIKASAGAGGAMEGNANQWRVRDVYFHSTLSDAFYIQGADTNGGNATGILTHVVGGCAIRCESSYNNVFHGMQITGYGNEGVYHLGGCYVLIDPTAGDLTSGTGVTPGTNNRKWYKMGAAGAPTAQYPQWVDDGSHFMKLQIFDAGGGSHYYNPYVEAGGAGACHVIGASHIYGGIGAPTMYSNVSRNIGGLDERTTYYNQGVGSFNAFDTNAQAAEYTQNGAFVTVKVGGTPGSFSATGDISAAILEFAREKDTSGNPWRWGYYNEDIRFSQLNGKVIWEITTPTTTKQFGRSVVQPNYLTLHDPVLVDPGGLSSSRVIGIRANRALPTDAGSGEFYHEIYAAGWGALGWVCTAPHATAPTWHSVPVFGLTSATPQYNGHLVVECTSNTSLTFKYKGSDGVVRSASLTLA